MSLDIGDLIEVKVNSSIFGQRIITTFPYRVREPSFAPNVNTLLQGIADYFMSGTVSPGLSFVACCPQNLNIDTITAQVVYPYRARFRTSVYNQPGTDPNDATSANSAGSVERATDFAGRSEVGRVSIPALAPANQVSGLISAGMLAKMSTLGSKMLNVWSNPLIDPLLELQPVIIHRKKNATTNHWEIVGASTCTYSRPQLEVRTQRTRNLGKGI